MAETHPLLTTRRPRSAVKRRSCICDCDKSEQNLPLKISRPRKPTIVAFAPSNQQILPEAELYPATPNSDSQSHAPFIAIKTEPPSEDIKENRQVLEQFAQICTDLCAQQSHFTPICDEVKVEKIEVKTELAKDEIDTKMLVRKIVEELRRLNLSQTMFARNILNRSQGTLSDILRRPQPWTLLGSGRHTYKRMADWLRLPDEQKLQFGEKDRNSDLKSSKGPRKQKFTFTNWQKQALQSVFEENPRPSQVKMLVLSEQLLLDEASVYNFFRNARRRQSNFKSKVADISPSVSPKPKALPKMPRPSVAHVTGD